MTLAGNLDIIASPGLPNGTSWTILNKTSAGAVSGTFASKPQGAAFVASGYTWTINYTGGDGNDVVLTAQSLTAIEQWRQVYFGSSANTGTGADAFDANKDGEVNLLEFATGQDPHTATLTTPALVKNGATLEFTYTRSKAAVADGVTFAVEWSDTLGTNSWDNAGVTEQVLTDNGTVQTVKASVAAGVARRFLHLKISKP